MSLSMFLQVRGWLVIKRKDGTVCFSYRRIGDCLRVLGSNGAENYFRVSAMFDHLFRLLQSREITPITPYKNG